MSVWLIVIMIVQVVAAIAVVALVLTQHGKGADMGAAFGSGSAGSLFGASGSANFLSRSTAVLATIFFAATLALAYFGNRPGAASGAGSVLSGAQMPAPAASTNEQPAPATTQQPKESTQTKGASQIPTN